MLVVHCAEPFAVVCILLRHCEETRRHLGEFIIHGSRVCALASPQVARGAAEIKGKTDLITEKIGELKRMLMV